MLSAGGQTTLDGDEDRWTDHVKTERDGVTGDEPRRVFRPVNHGSHDPPRITYQCAISTSKETFA